MIQNFRKITYLIYIACSFSLLACKQKPTQPVLYSNIEIEEAMSLISSNTDLVIMDVRTAEETSEGMIPNAIELDFRGQGFEEKLIELDKTKPYLVYCRSGSRSERTSEMMQAMGFEEVYNLLGGYTAWSESQ